MDTQKSICATLRRYVLGIAWLPIFLATLPSPAAATTADVDSRGGLNTAVQIEVPSFYGITPMVKIGYQDSGGNLAGVGWDLIAGSTISRTSATRGTPLFTGGDKFFLDGEELVPCAVGSISPSCTTAIAAFGSATGFYSTWIDHYWRVRHSRNSWTLWEPDGTRRIYMSGDRGLTYRLRSVTDTHGNRVKYDWSCPIGRSCQLDAIRYGATQLGAGVAIQIYREVRPDIRSYSTGLGRSESAERLRSIVVRQHGGLLRAYRLQYLRSQETGASLLASVQQFGSDATVDPSGDVSAGATPPLPAVQFGYPSQSSRGHWQLNADVNSPSLLDVSLRSGAPLPPVYGNPYTDIAADVQAVQDGDIEVSWYPNGFVVGDFDGNGRNEVLVWGLRDGCSTLTTRVRLSGTSGLGPEVHSLLRGGVRVPTSRNCKASARVADVNGDGLDDLVVSVDGQLRVALALPNGTFVDGGHHTWPTSTDQCVTADVDGDGRTDLICVDHQAHLIRTYRANQNFDSFTQVSTNTGALPNWGDHTGLEMVAADIDGDGLTDVVLARPNPCSPSGQCSTDIVIGISRGDGTYQWEPQTLPVHGKLAAADLDGDGRTDIVLTAERISTNPQGSTTIHAALSRKGYGRTERFKLIPPITANLIGVIFADVNGDGRADLLGSNSTVPGNDLAFQLANPDGGFEPVQSSHVDCYFGGVASTTLAADLNGDGLVDPFCVAEISDTEYRIVDRPSQPSGADRHRWLRADLNGDGRTELIYVAFNNPGYTVSVVSLETQTRTTYTIAPNGSSLKGLIEPDAGRWMLLDAGSPSGPADGKMDLVLVEKQGSTLLVTTLLSAGQGNFNPIQTQIGSSSADQSTLGWLPVNLNGDGVTDLARLRPAGVAPNNRGVTLETLRATGGGHFAGASNTYFAGAMPSSQRFFPVDVNGDGLTDFVRVEPGDTGHMTFRTLRARAGAGFDEITSFLPNSGVNDVRHWRIADIDGDGLADVYHVDRAGACLNIKTLMGDGLGRFTDARTYTAQVCPPAGSQYDHLFDDSNNLLVTYLKGDSVPEFVYLTHQHDAADTGHLIVTLIDTSAVGPWTVSALEQPLAYDLGDSWSWNSTYDPISGNSGLSYVHPQAAMTLGWQRVRDELTTIDNGLGLGTLIGRSPYLGSRSYLPAGMVPRVVTRVAVSDAAAYPKPVGDSTTYNYGGARWSDQFVRFSGFEMTTQRPAQSQSDERAASRALYRIDDACGTRVSQRELRDPQSGALWEYSLSQPDAVSSGPPYRCLQAVGQRYSCERGPCRLVEQTVNTHDVYGNLVQELKGADQALPRLTYQPVNANPNQYIVDRPAYRLELGWDGNAWKSISGALYYYDNASNWSAPPAGKGDRTAVDNWDDESSSLLRTTYKYFASGDLKQSISPGGKKVTVSLDSVYHRFPSLFCDGMMHCTTQSWNYLLGKVEDVTDPNHAVTHTEYDEHGRLKRTDYPLGGRVVNQYLAMGSYTGPVFGRQRIRKEIRDGSPGDDVLWSESFFDGSGRVYREAREGSLDGHDPTVSIMFKDASTRPWRVSEVFDGSSSPTMWTDFRYDGLGRPASVIHPDLTAITSTYAVGAITTTDENQVGQVRRLNGRGQVIALDELSRSGSPNAMTRYDYDAAERLTNIVDARNNVTNFTWSSLGRKTSSRDPDRGQRLLSYWPDGELRKQTDALGQQISYTYDILGRVSSEAEAQSTGAAGRTVKWSYDDTGQAPHGASLGRLVRVDDIQGATALSTEFWYDLAGRTRLTRKCIDRQCMDQDREYDLAGRVSTWIYPDASGSIASTAAERLLNTYDSAGQIQSVGNYVPSIRYDIDGQRHAIDYGNGLTTTYDYDPARRWLNSISIGNLQQFDYRGRDPVGRIMRQVATGVQTADLGYFYDDLGRLSRVDSSDPLRREQLSYDELCRLRWSQRLGDAHYADPAHVHAVTATDYGAQRRYDGNGNMTYLKDPTNASNPVGRELKLGWSIDDHVAQIDDILHSQGFRFTYDIGGRRAIKKELNGNTSRYFGPLLELKTDPSGNSKLVKYYLAGDTLVAMNDGRPSYFHADVAHATRLETDLTGHVANTYQYWSFGEPYKSTQTISNDIGYSGARTDETLGLILMGARVYDPVLGQFLSADSVIPNTFRPQSLNRYSYVENDPVNHWDPSGHLRASVEYQKMREAETTFAQLRAALNQCNNPFVSCGVPGSFHFALPKMFDERVVLADPTDPLGSIHVDEPSPPPAGDSGSKSDDKAWRHPDDGSPDSGKSIDELIAKYGEGDGGTGQCQIGCQIGQNIATGKPRPTTGLDIITGAWFTAGIGPAVYAGLMEMGLIGGSVTLGQAMKSWEARALEEAGKDFRRAYDAKKAIDMAKKAKEAEDMAKALKSAKELKEFLQKAVREKPDDPPPNPWIKKGQEPGKPEGGPFIRRN